MTLIEDELRRAYLERLRSFEDLISDAIGGLDDSSVGLAKALSVALGYPKQVRKWFLADWDRDPATRLGSTRLYSDHLTETIIMVDEWLLRACDLPPPPYLGRCVERECGELGLDDRLAVLTIQDPSNFATLVADFEEQLYAELDQANDLTFPVSGPQLALIHVPRLEGDNPLLLPTLIGHEVAHLYVEKHGIADEIERDADFVSKTRAVGTPDWWDGEDDPEIIGYALEEAATAWIEELLCDAYSVQRFGPAAIQALGVFQELNGARSPSKSHPPGWTRAALMLTWLGSPDEGASSDLDQIRETWSGYRPPLSYDQPDWVTLLIDRVTAMGDWISETVKQWPGEPYRYTDRDHIITAARDRLMKGLPTAVLDRHGDEEERITDSDIVNAGWLAAREDERVPVARLVRQSIETLQFLEQWDRASSSITDSPPEESAPTSASPEGEEVGVLSRDAIRGRLRSSSDKRIELIPCLPGSVDDSAVDLRLGNKFLVFRSSVVDSFDPLELKRDPRAMQRRIEKAWGDTFVLHPNELVLASALEYLALPADVAGQVHTRSSYGRLGLIAATALHVHPWYMGALTLELVNLSEVPLRLTPGERVAQLVLYRVDPPAPPPSESKKYRCSTFPEFSKVRRDYDSAVLREMQRQLHKPDPTPADEATAGPLPEGGGPVPPT